MAIILQGENSQAGQEDGSNQERNPKPCFI